MGAALSLTARRAGATWRGWRSSVVVAVAAYAVYRLVTEVVALYAFYGLQFPHVVGHNPSALLLPWSHWDAGLYRLVADQGYGAAPGLPAFAPMLPASMKGAMLLLHVKSLAAGMLVANLALLLGLIVVHRLVSEEHGGKVATTALVLLLAWPAAFFLGAPYTEPLALLFAASAFLAARRRRWLLTGVLAMLLVMTKFWLLVILVPLLWQRRQQGGGRRLMLRDAAAVVVPTALALVGWALYMHHLTGDALAFLHAQADFNRHVAPPWVLFGHELSVLFHLDFLDTTVSSATEPFDFAAVLLVGAMAVWWWRQRRRDYAIWLGLGFAVFVCETFLMGEVREVLILFPVFSGLAVIVQRRAWVERVFTAVALPGAVFLLTRFVAEKFAG